MKDKDYIEKAKKSAFDRLSFEQRIFIEDNLDTMKRSDIAEAINISLTQLKRAAQYCDWKFTHTKGFADLKYNPMLVKEVLDYYDLNGKKKTQEKFNNLKVRSIVERYGKGRFTRCKKWTILDKIELLKMAGIISSTNQSNYFNRPRANKGSIVSVWQKFFNCRQSQVNGLPEYKAKYFVKKECPYIKTGFKNNMKLYLWSDCINYLKDDCPDFIIESIFALSSFQKKVFKSKQPGIEIEKIIKEREN